MAYGEKLNKINPAFKNMPADQAGVINQSINDRNQDTNLSARVLIIDDNLESAKTMGWALEIFGHEVRIELSGRKGIETAEEFKPQVVLMDIGMPGMNGYETCQLMRNIPGLERTVFIAQTGWGQESDRMRSIDAGFAHHLVKPVEIMTLQETVVNAVKSF